MTETIYAGKMPILALRGLAVFPEQTVHFDVGREKSVRALEAAMKADQTLFLIPQKDLLVDDPKLKDLYAIGTVAKVKQVLKTQGENLRILVTGVCRGKITELQQSEPYLEGLVEAVSPSKTTDNVRAHALRREAVSLYGLYLQMSEHPAQAIQLRMMASEDTGFIADAIAQNSGIDFPDKAKMLCQLNPVKRLETALRLLSQEVEMLRLESDIQEKTRSALDQNQRDYYIREQIKVLQDELGEGDEASEYENYIQSIRGLHLQEDLEKKLLKDVERLKKQPFGSSEGAVLRNYLDTVLDLPWNKKTKERVDVASAKKILEHDHFGLEKVKERILETIAVRQMAPEMPPQILCLVGPGSVKRCMALASALGVSEKIRVLGGRNDVPELLLASDLMVHPAREESAGSVLVEGIASGLPVLCSGECGFSPYVRESGGTVLSEPFSQQELNEQLKSMLPRLEEISHSVRSYAGSADFCRREEVALEYLESAFLSVSSRK